MSLMTNTFANPKISIEGMSKVYPLGNTEFKALDNVSLDVADNEFITVVGPSGCGKSTTRNILAGLETVSGGQALVDGIAVDGPGPERGVIFPQYALFPWLTGRDNVEFDLKTAKMLSGGIHQRCAIAPPPTP